MEGERGKNCGYGSQNDSRNFFAEGADTMGVGAKSQAVTKTPRGGRMTQTAAQERPRIAVTVPEAARLISQPLASVRGWCATGRLPARKIGKSWLIRLDTLDEMTRAAAKESTKEPVMVS